MCIRDRVEAVEQMLEFGASRRESISHIIRSQIGRAASYDLNTQNLPEDGSPVWGMYIRRLLESAGDEREWEMNGDYLLTRWHGCERLLYLYMLLHYEYLDYPDEGRMFSVYRSRCGPNSALPSEVCRICGESGHWGNECPNICLLYTSPSPRDRG